MNTADIQTRFHDNLARVRNLAKMYDKALAPVGRGRRPVNSADVLRAAVVLLHATLEDFIRTIAHDLLPLQEGGVLNKVPLSGTGEHGRPEKFLLGRLVQFRGETVDQVLSKSVEAFLERSNYNKPDDLASVIADIGLDKTKVESLFGSLSKMMERRHWIVHRADRNPESGSGQHKCKSIGTKCLDRWITTVETFANEILKQLT